LPSAYVKAGKSAEATALVQERLAAARHQLEFDRPRLAGVLASSGNQLLGLKQYVAAELSGPP
jgi:hypothetical protein